MTKKRTLTISLIISFDELKDLCLFYSYFEL